MLPYIGEFLGTAMLILIGESLNANVTLNKSSMRGAGPLQVTIGWGLAVMVPACIFGQASGASFNPALTIALAAAGMFDWALVPGYIIAQFAGAFCGACLVYVEFIDQFAATSDEDVILGVFSTSPSVPNFIHNLTSEIIGTFVLVFSIMGMNQVPELSAGVNKLLVFGLITSIGMSFGGVTGYAINPARDLGPRLAHTVLPIKRKGSSHWDYAIVPLLGPIIGALLAAGLYCIIPW